MAAFNKAENEAVVSTGLSNASRGMPADQSLGTLFEGVGNALQAGLNAYDESTKVKIQMAADEAVNGSGGAVEAAMPDENGNLPPGAQASLGNIASYKAALDQGTISQVTFDTRVAQEAKRIRSSVPKGYGPMVESALSAAVGSSTANQLRQTQLQAMKTAQGNISAEHDATVKWMDTNIESLMDENVRQDFKSLTGGKYSVEQMITSPDPSMLPLLRLSVANRKSLDSNANRVKQEIETRNLIREDQVSILADKFIGDSFNENISKDYGALITARNAASDPNGPNGAGWSAEESQQVATAFQAFNLGAHTNMEKFLADSQVSDDVRTKIRTRIDERMNAWKGYLDDPNMGALGASQRMWTGQKREFAQRFAGTSDLAAFLVYASEAGISPDIVNGVLNASAMSESKEQAMKALTDPALLSVLVGRKTISEANTALAQSSDNANREVKLLYDGIAKSLNLQTGDAVSIANMAKNIFDPKNKDMLNQLAAENRVGTFERLITPSLIDNLVKSGDQGAIAFATQWANDQFDVISQSAQKTIIDRQANSAGLKFKFENGQFAVESIQSAAGSYIANRARDLAFPGAGALTEVWDYRQNSNAMQAVSDINRYMKVMEPIWKAQGTDAASAMALKIGDITRIEKAPSLMKSLGDALLSSLSPVSKAEASEGGGGKPASNAELTAQAAGQSLPDADAGQLLGFISKAEGADYNTLFGGSKVDLSGMTVSEVQQMQRSHGKKTGSSATGAYQVMRKTLSGLIDNGIVDPDEKFTPEVQDKIGMALLKGRGYDDWKAGKMSTEQFANNLAREWASLPMSNGLSAYHGDSMGNKSTRSRGKLVAMLEDLRNS